MAQRTSDDNRPYGYNIIDDVIADVTELYSLVGNGGNSTQKYVAYIKQTGTSAPDIVRVFENSANLTVTTSYTEEGIYTLSILPTIDVAKFRASFQNLNASTIGINWNVTETNIDLINLYSILFSGGGFQYSDGLLDGIIEITVYN